MPRVAKTAFNVAVSDDVFRRQIIRAIEPRARRTGFQSFIRVSDDRQFVVIDFDQAPQRLPPCDDCRRPPARSVRRHSRLRRRQDRLGSASNFTAAAAKRQRNAVAVRSGRRSAYRKTACTPGSALAAAYRLFLMRACAERLRANTACKHVGQDDVVDVARPGRASSRASSTRGTERPIKLAQQLARQIALSQPVGVSASPSPLAHDP